MKEEMKRRKRMWFLVQTGKACGQHEGGFGMLLLKLELKEREKLEGQAGAEDGSDGQVSMHRSPEALNPMEEKTVGLVVVLDSRLPLG